MKIPPFKLERYFAQYEFKVRYLLSASDCESLSMSELLEMSDAESLALWRDLRLSYTESEGHPRLRQAIARLYEKINPEQILVAVPEEAIFLAINLLLNPGDRVIALLPAYQSLHEIARALGCEVTPWHVQLDSHGWRLDLDWLAKNISANVRLLVVNFPHNPTGYLPSQAEFDEIIRLTDQNGVYLLCDEMYRGLEYRKNSQLRSAADQYERAISLSGLSKTYALPGLRIGWLASQDPTVIASALAYKDYTTICASAPSEILGIIALQNDQKIIERNLAIIQENRSAAKTFFGRYPALFEWHDPDAGSVAFTHWIGDGCIADFCQAAVDQLGIMIAPGHLFGGPDGFFRVGLGRKNFPEAIDHLDQFIQKRFL